MNILFRCRYLILLLCASNAFAGPLQEAAINQIVNEVKLVDPRKGARPAAVKEVIRDDLGVRTGIQSRAELLFQDKTLTRLGAETFFSFKAGTRDLKLDRGTLLLQVPKGLGGAKIRAASVTASITGTTIMMEHLPGKSIKVLVLEGSLRLEINKRLGTAMLLTPGKMVIMKPNARSVPQPVTVDLRKVIKTSSLIDPKLFKGKATASADPLPSMGLIATEIALQEKQITEKGLIATNLVIPGNGTDVVIASDAAMDRIDAGADNATALQPTRPATNPTSVLDELPTDATRVASVPPNDKPVEPTLPGSKTDANTGSGDLFDGPILVAEADAPKRGNDTPVATTSPLEETISNPIPTVRKPANETTPPLVTSVTDTVSTVLPSVVTPVTETVSTVLPPVVTPVIETVSTVLPPVVTPVIETVSTVLPPVVTPVIETVSTVLPPVVTPVIETVSTVLPAITIPLTETSTTTAPPVTIPLTENVSIEVPAVIAPVTEVVSTVLPAVTAPLTETTSTLLPSLIGALGGTPSLPPAETTTVPTVAPAAPSEPLSFDTTLPAVDLTGVSVINSGSLPAGQALNGSGSAGGLLAAPGNGRHFELRGPSISITPSAIAGVKIDGGNAALNLTQGGGDGGLLVIGTSASPIAGNITVTSPISATTGANSILTPTGGKGGSVQMVSNGQVVVGSQVKVSESASGKASRAGGTIAIRSNKTSGQAITVTNSGELLALLNAAAPGAGGTIKFVSAGGDILVDGGKVRADRGKVEVLNTGANGLVALRNASVSGDVVKIGAVGANGQLIIGGGTLSADSTLKLYGGATDGLVRFTDDTTLGGDSLKIIAGRTVTIDNGRIVTVQGSRPASVFTDRPNYTGSGGNGSTTGQFGGAGATTQPYGGRPKF
jgi:hypothetical protein